MKLGTFVATQWTVRCAICGETYAVSRTAVDQTGAEALRASGSRFLKGLGWVCEPCLDERAGKAPPRPDPRPTWAGLPAKPILFRPPS